MHIPVLLKEAVDFLSPRKGEFVVDLTAGTGGHSYEFAKKIGKEGKILLVDWDEKSLPLAESKILSIPSDERPDIISVVSNFRDIDWILNELESRGEIKGFPDIFFADLGISSFQLDDPSRGFSLSKEGPLDMRISREIHVKARDIIMQENPLKLEEIFREYGEEKLARSIAREIARTREKKEIRTTRELAEIVEMVYKRARRGKGKIHPATRVFMALRIYINRELENLAELLSKLPYLSRKGTRVGIISFHSLEDRIVKRSFSEWEKVGWGRVLTKKPVTPSEEEVIVNPRSRSAKFRAFVFLSPPESH